MRQRRSDAAVPRQLDDGYESEDFSPKVPVNSEVVSALMSANCSLLGSVDDVTLATAAVAIKSAENSYVMKKRTRRKRSTGSCTAAEYHDSERRSLQSEMKHLAKKMAEQAEELVLSVCRQGWKVVSHHSLPSWLKDNDLLLYGHRPQLNSFKACFKSVFRIHTETGNIWTHLIGCLTFFIIAAYFLTRPAFEVQWREKLVYAAFFLGAILCLGFSFLFHTVYCHSESVGRLFNKLDYCGIALLTIGSFVPWLYYAFYCHFVAMVIYLVVILILGTICIIVSMWDKFASPRFRPIRAAVFVAFGSSGCVPITHYIIQHGLRNAFYEAGFGWIFLIGFLYVGGALVYALRFPERLFPGKFDIWFQSHQIFHVFVVAAALVTYYGINGICKFRLTYGDCLNDTHVNYVDNASWEL